MENIDILKEFVDCKPKYKLSNANVIVSPGGYHYIDYLDPIEDISSEVDGIPLTDEDVIYIEKSLQSNYQRFENQVNIVKSYETAIRSKKVLDIGCGGGLFLSMLSHDDVIAIGIELNGTRALYARTKYNLEIIKRPIEDVYWLSQAEVFDIVTLWDVIEHVNYPLSTLQSSSKVIKSGGLIFVDTPCRDSFYHRFGELTYWLSNGKFPTFLNSMYSAHRFGHKQIFSAFEIKDLFNRAGYEVLELKRFHELSFPYSFYLKKIFKSNMMVKLCLPIVNILLTVFPIKNKMMIVGRKR